MGVRLHVRETEPGRWTCSTAHLRIDEHRRLVDAVAHLRAEAAALHEPELWLHLADGSSERIAMVPLVP